MRSKVTKPASLILFLLILLSACTKDPVVSDPPPGNGGEGGDPIAMGTLRFTTNADLTGQPYHTSNLRAVVTVVNERNEEVIKDSILSLSLPNPVTTGAIQLPKGNYRLTSFRMEYGSVYTHFAAPLAGSPKAAMVQHPLALSFAVEKNGNIEIPVDVLRVQAGEKPQQYGYPSGAFDYGQEDANPYMKVKIRAIMKIGDVVYDSIPASLTLTTWNNKGEMTTTYSALRAGINEVPVLKSAVKYEFMVSKWGINDAMTLNRRDVDDATVYTLGGSKAAKKLRSELVYKQVNGTYLPESKNSYFYDAAGRLSRIEYLLKNKENRAHLAMSETFEYTDGRASKITRIDEENKSILSVTSFGYDAQGKVTSISQNDNGVETHASVEYFYGTQKEIKIHYTYPGKTYDMDYYMSFIGGNMTTSSASTSNHSTELGRYDHDFGINPYIHMNWPNLFLSNSNKNNVTTQYKEYNGNYPVADPYSFNYTYDADGYPKEVIKHFKSPVTGNFLFSTKTVFAY